MRLKMTYSSRQLSFFFFLAVLIFSPLAFGTVEPWSYAVMEIMIGLCALSWLAANRKEPFYRPPGLVPLLLTAAFILLQVIPLPAGWVSLLSPESFRLKQQVAAVFDGPGWMSLSVYPRATVMELTRFLSYLVFYVVAVQILSDHVLRKRTLAIITVMAALLSLFVIIQFITRHLGYSFANDKILGIRSSLHGAAAIGPYVNRNHYAGLMEMIFPLVTAMFLAWRPRVDGGGVGLKSRLRDLLSGRRTVYHLLFGTAALLIGTSVFVSLSRAGIFSLTVSMLLMTVWLARQSGRIKAGPVLAALLLFVGIMVLTGSDAWNRIFERFGELRTVSGELYHPRFHYWQDGLNIIRDFLLTGSGLGTWQHIYPLYRTLPSGRGVLEHAHGDYIEFMATGGILLAIPALLVLWRVAAMSFAAYQGYQRGGQGYPLYHQQERRERLAVYLFAASLAGVFSILLHSVVDFNLQVGANGLYFFFLLAMMTAAAHARFPGKDRAESGVPAGVSFLPRVSGRGGWRTGLVVVFLGGVVLLHGGVMLANYHYAAYRDMRATGGTGIDSIRKAAALDPLNPDYQHIAANMAALQDKPDTAAGYYRRAIRLNPLDPRLLQDGGIFFFLQKDSDRAEQLLRAGIRHAPDRVEGYLAYAAALVEDGRLEEGVEIFRAAMAARPQEADTCLAVMVWLGLPESMIIQAMPDRPEARRALKDYLISLGRHRDAADLFPDD